ncbi:MAG: glycine/betaine ABC transporter substrate-binding protein [Rhodospirillaceae bacterium]|nr:glycine/betaine ABC transporter substrate-binding protein [Rhodospirillaceae bacterium]|tara:strand:+ start:4404 stop:5372 length:969 start_codon:yes stop_codon:yes gene_type:complete
MNLTRKFLSAVAGGALMFGVAASGHAQNAETDEPIRLAMNEWTGQHVSTTVAGEVLKRMGYNVEYVTAGYYPQVQAMAEGDLDASLEIWSSNIGDGWDEHFDSGAVEIVANSGLQPQEAWYVPAYVVDMCPGLPNWEALNDCVDLFATPETLPSGRFLDYPADWGDKNRPRIEALGLDFINIQSGGEGAIIAEIKSAYERQAPLLTMFWEPHWIHAQYDLQRVYLPEYEEGCLEDPALGPNPDVAWDCDWAGAEIWKVANPSLEGSHPNAWGLIEAYSITNAEQAAMMSEIDDKGRDLAEVVNEWLDNNPDKMQAWIDQATM